MSEAAAAAGTPPLPGATRVEEALDAARDARPAWRACPLRDRLALVRRLRRRLAQSAADLAAGSAPAHPREPAETMVAEVFPLLAACRWLERDAARVLAARPIGPLGRPLWLWGSRGAVAREPFGTVLVIGPANYPLMLPGIQALQALVAGNAVVLKPGRGGSGAARALESALRECGLPAGLLTVLDESDRSGAQAVDAGVDLVVVTGHADTGRRVLERLAAQPCPAIVELSGCDAMVVRRDADLDLAADAAAFGLRFNAGATCIAPRRILVDAHVAGAFEDRLAARLAGLPEVALEARELDAAGALVRDAVDAGARVAAGGVGRGGMSPTLLAGVTPRMRAAGADVFAPLACVLATRGDDEAVALVSGARYRLGASVFGEPRAARALARRLDVGTVTVNDLIVPTADPRAPFGGCGASGFGVTRGAEGLLSMTRPKTVFVRRGRARAHFRPLDGAAARALPALASLLYGSWPARARALGALMRSRRAGPGSPPQEISS